MYGIVFCMIFVNRTINLVHFKKLTDCSVTKSHWDFLVLLLIDLFVGRLRLMRFYLPEVILELKDVCDLFEMFWDENRCCLVGPRHSIATSPLFMTQLAHIFQCVKIDSLLKDNVNKHHWYEMANMFAKMFTVAFVFGYLLAVATAEGEFLIELQFPSFLFILSCYFVANACDVMTAMRCYVTSPSEREQVILTHDTNNDIVEPCRWLSEKCYPVNVTEY